MKRKKKGLVKFLETDQLRKLEEPLTEKTRQALNKNELTITDVITIRDFAVLNLIYACGLRISEACNLELEHLDLEKKIAYILDSKGDDRTIAIPSQTIEILKEWFSVRPNWKNNPYVFTNVKGTTRPGKVRPLNRRYYNQVIDKLSEMTEVKMKGGKKPTPHTLRHSRAMEWYDNGATLDLIQAALGHKSIQTTQVYAKVRDSKIAEMQNQITGGLISL